MNLLFETYLLFYVLNNISKYIEMYTEKSSTYFNPRSARPPIPQFKIRESDEIIFKNEENIRNLKNYRCYIHEQMESLHKQFIKEEEENQQVLQRVYQADCMLQEMSQMLAKQLQKYNSMYTDLLRQKDELQVRNLNNISKLRQTIEEQSALNKIATQNKSLHINIGNEIEKNKKQRNNEEIMTMNEVKKKELQLINKQILNFKQNQQHFHANDGKLIDRIKYKEEEVGYKSKIVVQLNQQINKTNKLKIQKQKQKISLLQKRKSLMENKQYQIKIHKQALERLLVQEKNEKYLINQQQSLVYSIKLALKDLELEQRKREKEQDYIDGEKEWMKNNMYQLQSLKYYYQELNYSNQIIRKSAHQFGLLRNEYNMTFQQSKVQANQQIQKKDDYVQPKTIQKLQVRPVVEEKNNKENNKESNLENNRENKKEKDRIFIEQQKQNLRVFLGERKNAPEQGVAQECQIRLQKYKAHQIPKEVSDIIKKYKEKQSIDSNMQLKPISKKTQKKESQNCLQEISNRVYSMK